MEGPVEEAQHFLGLGRIGLLLLHQNEAGAGYRPAVGARLVRQQQIEAWRL